MSAVIEIIIPNLEKNITDAKERSTYNRKRIFARARYIYKTSGCTWSEALTQSWYESRKCVIPAREELKHLQTQLMDIYAPVQYKHINNTESVNRKMSEAFANGAKMN